MTVAGEAAGTDKRNSSFARHAFALPIMLVLVAALLIVGIIAASTGAAQISLGRIASALLSGGDDSVLTARDQMILLSIRLPRIVMASTVGALLAGAGTIMQGLFRN